ncbi:MAG: aminoacyl-tRNA hydrolase [Bacteroidales bacterium]
MKYLIVGLGNIGDEYVNTRHNVGFQILDAFAKASNISFQDSRLAFRAEYKIKGRTIILIKPTTFMNLSGRAVNYWLQKEKIPEDKLLVIVDDIALPFGTLRLRPKGSDAGHNGLADINLTLGHQNYARLRFGIGDDFPKGFQVQYVLGEWTEEEKKILPQKFDIAAEIIKSFGLVGLAHTMNQFNKK